MQKHSRQEKFIEEQLGMKKGDKQKMCTQCDARLPLDSVNCIYCGAKVMESSSLIRPLPSEEQGGLSFYKPPYSARFSILSDEGSDRGSAEEASREDLPSSPLHSYSQAPYSADQDSPIFRQVSPECKTGLEGVTAAQREDAPSEASVDPKTTFLATTLLLLASYLLILGALQLFFAEEGVLTLQWNAERWYFYVLGAFPLLYVGYKKLELLR